MATLKTSWNFNANGSLTVSFMVQPRRIKTLLHWQVVNIASGESSEGLRRETDGLRYPLMDGGNPYSADTAWDSESWVFLGETPTTCSTTQQQQQVFTITVPASSNNRRLLLIREGVWKHSGDEAWLASNLSTVSCANTNPQWYQSSGAIGFYSPVVASTYYGEPMAPAFNSGAFPPELDPEGPEEPDARYPEEAAAHWLVESYDWEEAFSSGLALPFVARGEAVRLAWPDPTRYIYAGHPYNGIRLPEGRRIPSLTTGQITSNVSEVKGNDKATISLSFPTADASDLLQAFVGDAEFDRIYYRQPGFLGTISAPSTKLRVVGGTLSNLRLPVTQRQTTSSYYDSPVLGTTYFADFTPGVDYSGAVEIELPFPGTHGVLKAQDNFVGALSSVALIANGRNPVLTITSQRPTLGIGSSTQVTFLSSLATSDFTAADVTVTNGTLSSFKAVSSGAASALRFTGKITPTPNASGVVTVAVAANKFQSSNGQYQNDATSLSIPFDTTRPTVQIVPYVSSIRAGQTGLIAFILSKPVAGLTLGAISVSGGTLSNLQSVGGLSYTATLTPTAGFAGKAAVTVRAGKLLDEFGNANATSSATVAVSGKLPTVTITSSAYTLGVGGTSKLTFTLSSPATNFVVSDVTVVGGSISGFAGSGKTYTATFTPTANAAGSASVSVADQAFTDADGNGNTAGAMARSISYDTRPLTVSIQPPASDVRISSTVNARIAIVPSKTSLAKSIGVSDITVSSGKVLKVTRSGAQFVAEFRPTVAGTVTVSIAAGKIADTNGNKNAAVSETFTVL